VPPAPPPAGKRQLQAADSLGPLFAKLPDALICFILIRLATADVLRLAAASRLFRIFCGDETLWARLALAGYNGPLVWLGSWRASALALSADHGAFAGSSDDRPPAAPPAMAPLSAPAGFMPDLLTRRWNRCRLTLGVAGFAPPAEHVERVAAGGMTAAAFAAVYDDSCRPVILTGALDGWDLNSWALPELLKRCAPRRPHPHNAPLPLPPSLRSQSTCAPHGLPLTARAPSLSSHSSLPPQKHDDRHGGTRFQVSKPAGGTLSMRLRDFAAYAAGQADEEPLYIFDGGFGRAAPELLRRYAVPAAFDSDYLEARAAPPGFCCRCCGCCCCGGVALLGFLERGFHGCNAFR